MIPRTWPNPDVQRMMVIDGARATDATLDDLDDHLQPGDVMVVNDAATLPGSLQGHIGNSPVELRLIGTEDDVVWRGLLFGAGDWRTDTDHRPPPPSVSVEQTIKFPHGLSARVTAVDEDHARLLSVQFNLSGVRFWNALYRVGRVIQYSYMRDDLPLGLVQTPYATRPWAVEMPSAGRPLTWRRMLRLKERGVHIVTLTHAAGLSATGDQKLDALLPFPERSELPQETVHAIQHAKETGGRVIAVGTSVVRALEDNASRNGKLLAGRWLAELTIDNNHQLRVVDGLLSGMHSPGESHFKMWAAFTRGATLMEVYDRAANLGYRDHEFGDSTLLWARH